MSPTAPAPTAASTAAFTAAVRASAPLTVEVSATVNVEETVNLVALFTRMNERDQKRYHALDAHEFSITAEWERPLAYLWPDASDLIPMSMIPGNPDHPRGDLHDSDVRVIYRDGERTVGTESRWTEADYSRLASLVPWLATHAGLDDPLDTPPSDAALAAGDKTLVVEVKASFGVEETTDLCALFARMDANAQQRYFNLGLSEIGFDAEWERPLAYLWPDDDDLVPYAMVPHSASHPRGMSDDADIRVVQRHGNRNYGREARWTEADYDTLASHVPWLRRHHAASEMSEHDRARLPGPLDVPLFG